MADAPDHLRALIEDHEPEELDPALEACLFMHDDGWVSLKHPLVYSIMHNPMFNRMVNVQFKHKKKALAQAELDGDWATYIWLHERPYRSGALAAIADRLDGPTYWELLASVWIDSENIVQMRDQWDELLADTREGREFMMSDDERAALAALPELITVYQGHTDERDDGWSWTTDRDIAEWFAGRFANLEGGEPRMTIGNVARRSVVAYLLRRNEYEVLVNPDFVVATREVEVG